MPPPPMPCIGRDRRDKLKLEARRAGDARPVHLVVTRLARAAGKDARVHPGVAVDRALHAVGHPLHFVVPAGGARLAQESGGGIAEGARAARGAARRCHHLDGGPGWAGIAGGGGATRVSGGHGGLSSTQDPASTPEQPSRWLPAAQAGHTWQSPAAKDPHDGAYCPGGQWLQSLQIPGSKPEQLVLYCPAPQASQASQGLAQSTRHSPGAHAGQSTQAPGLVPPHPSRAWKMLQLVQGQQLPGSFPRHPALYCPAGQLLHATHEPALDPPHPEAQDPAPQRSQWAHTPALSPPHPLLYVPAPHESQAWHTPALLPWHPVRYLPAPHVAGQARQTPGLEPVQYTLYCPSGQPGHGLQSPLTRTSARRRVGTSPKGSRCTAPPRAGNAPRSRPSSTSGRCSPRRSRPGTSRSSSSCTWGCIACTAPQCTRHSSRGQQPAAGPPGRCGSRSPQPWTVSPTGMPRNGLHIGERPELDEVTRLARAAQEHHRRDGEHHSSTLQGQRTVIARERLHAVALLYPRGELAGGHREGHRRLRRRHGRAPRVRGPVRRGRQVLRRGAARRPRKAANPRLVQVEDVPVHAGENTAEAHHDLVGPALRAGGGARRRIAVHRAADAVLVQRTGVGPLRAGHAGPGGRHRARGPVPLLPRAADHRGRAGAPQARHARRRRLRALVGARTAVDAVGRPRGVLVGPPRAGQAAAPLHRPGGVRPRRTLHAGRARARAPVAPRGAHHPVVAGHGVGEGEVLLRRVEAHPGAPVLAVLQRVALGARGRSARRAFHGLHRPGLAAIVAHDRDVKIVCAGAAEHPPAGEGALKQVVPIVAGTIAHRPPLPVVEDLEPAISIAAGLSKPYKLGDDSDAGRAHPLALRTPGTGVAGARVVDPAVGAEEAVAARLAGLAHPGGAPPARGLQVVPHAAVCVGGAGLAVARARHVLVGPRGAYRARRHPESRHVSADVAGDARARHRQVAYGAGARTRGGIEQLPRRAAVAVRLPGAELVLPRRAVGTPIARAAAHLARSAIQANLLRSLRGILAVRARRARPKQVIVVVRAGQPAAGRGCATGRARSVPRGAENAALDGNLAERK
eukprot:768787-Hanusia_phi.AAC.9